ncbi:MAG: bifunctional riboflavin kinase/FAD synthetase [Actinomycetales bacterium]|nr:bifunctional riboflavin kinase/FAD synthetase [Actinomycetales bacterium]
MELWNSIEAVPQDFAETVVTIGKFDGVHLGHQRLVGEAINLAEEHGLAAVVLTFDRHPNAVLNQGQLQLPITGPEQKHGLLAELGVDAVLTLPFDEALAALPAEEFIETYLVDALRAKAVVVGQGFRFGAGGGGDVALLRLIGLERGFVVREVAHAEFAGEKISSTRVRAALDTGDVRLAAELLNRTHAVRGIIEHGKKLGRTIGFPTANMSRAAEGYLPLDAVYAGWLIVNHDDGSQTGYPAALSVGINETFEAVPRVLEAYVLDRDDLDLYDLDVTMEFVEFVRPTLKFDSVETLIDAIKDDVARVRSILEGRRFASR